MLKGPKGAVLKITVTREGYTSSFGVRRDANEIPRHSVDIALMLKPGMVTSASHSSMRRPTAKSRMH